MNANEGIQHEQGTTVRRFGKYVRGWLRWMRVGVEISGVNVITVSHSQTNLMFTVFNYYRFALSIY